MMTGRGGCVYMFVRMGLERQQRSIRPPNRPVNLDRLDNTQVMSNMYTISITRRLANSSSLQLSRSGATGVGMQALNGDSYPLSRRKGEFTDFIGSKAILDGF